MARCAASIDLVAPIDFYGSLMVSLMTIFMSTWPHYFLALDELSVIP